jgi:AAA domain
VAWCRCPAWTAGRTAGRDQRHRCRSALRTVRRRNAVQTVSQQGEPGARSVTVPAGSGKTELIAATVAKIAAEDGGVLVLTHTHAGVDALRRRMRRLGVPKERITVRTIDSWSFDLIRHYPQLAELRVPAVPVWGNAPQYHKAAMRAARSTAVRRMLRVSHRLVLVDEYQDCLIDQHNLVLGLREAVPTAVFGDPLQRLFNFGHNRPVSWTTDVLRHSPTLALRRIRGVGTWTTPSSVSGSSQSGNNCSPDNRSRRLTRRRQQRSSPCLGRLLGQSSLRRPYSSRSTVRPAWQRIFRQRHDSDSVPAARSEVQMMRYDLCSDRSTRCFRLRRRGPLIEPC